MESLGSLVFPLLILVLFVPIFLSGRKQRRQMQEMSQLQSSLEVGDVVTTTSGLRGTVVDAQYEDTVDLEIAENVVTTWLRAAVRDRVVTADADHAVDHADDPVDDHLDDRAETRAAETRAVETRAVETRPVEAPPVDAPSDANGTPRP